MIGTLLYYALYPLSRYLSSRPSESSKTDLPPAVANGTAVWDCGVVTTRGFTQCQETPPDQCLSTSGGTKREDKERVNKPSPDMGDVTRPDTDKEQLMAVPHDEPKSEDASERSEVQPVVKGKVAETRSRPQQDAEEVPIQMDEEKPVHHEVFNTTQNTGDGWASLTEDINHEQEIEAQLECLQTDNSAQETTDPVQTKVETPSSEESVAPAEPCMQETISPGREQLQFPSTSAETPPEVTECWDEYTLPLAEEMHGSLSLCLSDTQPQFKHRMEHDPQTAWHFPAGPGLAEEMQCPLWQFPALSYYPPTEPMMPFEGMWRAWEEMDESVPAAEPASVFIPFTKASMDFTVMSYNILADDLLEANQELYAHCSMEVLDWSYRFSLLLEEILKWAPDILCLQEVQENHYHEQLYPVLSEMGYTCVYKRRTGTKTDGCATCYRSSCFSEVSVTPLEFFRPETELLDRHNVGIVLLLQPVVTQDSKVKAKGSPLCVANTHLLFNPGRGDVKLAQLAIMLAEIDSVVKSCKANGEHCNLILCGDFNSVPHMPLYQLITTGELYFQGLPAWMISGQEDLSHKAYCHRLFAPLWPSSLGITENCQYTAAEETTESQSQKPGTCRYSHKFMRQLRFSPAACIRPLDLELISGVTDSTPDASRENESYNKRFGHTLRHRLDLESVYKHVLPGSGNPEVTTLHSEVGATVDYIFYTPRCISAADEKAGVGVASRGLKLIGSLSLLSEDLLWSMRGLPNDIFPSDHLSLLAKFQLDLNAA